MLLHGLEGHRWWGLANRSVGILHDVLRLLVLYGRLLLLLLHLLLLLLLLLL